MQIVSYLLFLFAGFISFLTYRIGITDGVRLSKNEEPVPVMKKLAAHTQTESEKDFFNQYNKLMNYDFDKAGDMNE